MPRSSTRIHIPPTEIRVTGSLSQLAEHVGWGHRDKKIPESWNHTRGEGVTIVVLDSGSASHTDIGSNEDLDKSRSFVSGEGKIDLQGHGTHVAGIIAAQENGMGVVGIAPKARVITLKVLNMFGEGTSMQLGNALAYCLELKPDIINMSLGSYVRDKSIEPLYNILANEMNVAIVAAAGNYGNRGVMYPAKYPNVFSIGSYRKGRLISDFSSFEGNLVDFVAPGQDILSTFLENSYAVMSGTSMAAPFFSGLLALIISKFKAEGIGYSLESLRSILKANSIDLGNPGPDPYFGHGIINVENALKSIRDGKVDPIIIKEIPPPPKRTCRLVEWFQTAR